MSVHRKRQVHSFYGIVPQFLLITTLPVVGPLGGMNGCRDSVKGEWKDIRAGNENIFVPLFVKGLKINSSNFGLRWIG